MRPHPQRRRAAAAVELASVLPFVLYLCVIATDWARLLYFTITIDACARAGALYASDPMIAGQSRYTNLQDAARAEAPSLDPGPTVTSTTTTDGAGNASVLVTATLNFNTLTNLPGVPS